MWFSACNSTTHYTQFNHPLHTLLFLNHVPKREKALELLYPVNTLHHIEISQHLPPALSLNSPKSPFLCMTSRRCWEPSASLMAIYSTWSSTLLVTSGSFFSRCNGSWRIEASAPQGRQGGCTRYLKFVRGNIKGKLGEQMVCHECLVLTLCILTFTLFLTIGEDLAEPHPFSRTLLHHFYNTLKWRGCGYVASERPSQQLTSVRMTVESIKNMWLLHLKIGSKRKVGIRR